MNKLVFTRLRGRTAAVTVSESRVLQIDLEPAEAEALPGSMFVGKVKNIVKNIGAAFVEYRPGVNGYYSLAGNPAPVYTDGKDHAALKSGDEIVVQVERAAVKTKDAVLTSKYSLTGQYAVVTCGEGKLGISSKIRDTVWRKERTEEWEEKKAMFSIPAGLILRTNAYEVSPEEIWAEAAALNEKLAGILSYAKTRTCPSALYMPESFALRVARDAYLEQTEEIITDLSEVFEELKDVSPILVRFYDDSFPLSALYHLETALDRALSKTVHLKSGGSLVIEPTEAMTVVDVNSGKNTDKKDKSQTYFLTNLEAAKELALQLRLRNLSGIIVVDFIDMDQKEQKEALLKKLRGYLSDDPVRTILVDMTPLGLVEITRKKIRKPLHEVLAGSGKK